MSQAAVERRSRTRVGVVLALAMVMALPPGSVMAQPSLDELQQERREAEQRHSRQSERLEQAQRRLEELEDEFSLAVDEYHQAVERHEAVKEELATLQDEVDVLADALAARRERVGTVVRDLYKDGGGATTFEALLGSADASSTVDRLGYLRSAQRGQASALEGYVAERSVLDRQEADLQEVREREAEIAEELDTRRADLEEQVETQGEEMEELETVVASARQQVADARSAEQAEQERLEQERRERERREREREERERQRELARADRSSRDSGGSSGESSGNSSNSSSSSSASSSSAPSSSGAGAPSGAAAAAVQAAVGQVGTRYTWGGSSPSTGFDCSGLLVWAYRQAGVQIPVRSSSAMFSTLPRISRSELQPGDFLFFNTPVSHVAMYIGGGQMVEASRRGVPVRVTTIDRRGYRGAARPTR